MPKELKTMSDCKNCGRNSFHNAEDPNWVCMYCYHAQNAKIEKAVAVRVTIEFKAPTSYRLEDVAEKVVAIVTQWHETQLPGLSRKLPKLAEMNSELSVENVTVYPSAPNGVKV